MIVYGFITKDEKNDRIALYGGSAGCRGSGIG